MPRHRLLRTRTSELIQLNKNRAQRLSASSATLLPVPDLLDAHLHRRAAVDRQDGCSDLSGRAS